MATTGCVKTVEEFVDNSFIDENVIVHCKDNDKDYKKQEAGKLVAFIESKVNIVAQPTGNEKRIIK